MILLTKLDGTPIVVNDDQVLYAEAQPDTVLVFHGGSRLMVKENLAQLVEKSADYRRTRLTQPHIPTHSSKEP